MRCYIHRKHRRISRFYQSLGLKKDWDTFQDEEKKWRLIGMSYPEGNSQLVLKNNPNLNFAETEVVVEDVIGIYEAGNVSSTD